MGSGMADWTPEHRIGQGATVRLGAAKRPRFEGGMGLPTHEKQVETQSTTERASDPNFLCRETNATPGLEPVNPRPGFVHPVQSLVRL